MPNREINRQVGVRLRELREARDLKRWELASRVGVSPETVGRWERGEGGPSVAEALRLAYALDQSLSALVCGVSMEPAA